MPTSGVYKITNSVNGLIYIGSSVHIEQRWKTHISKAKWYSEEHPGYDCNSLHRAMWKIGVEKFSVECIELISDEKLMRECERYWIRKIPSIAPKGYNVATRRLTDEQAAIVRFNAYNLSRKEYAALFNVSMTAIRLVIDTEGSQCCPDPWHYLTRDHLPRDIEA